MDAGLSAAAGVGGSAAVTYSVDAYPYDCVCYITASFGNGLTYQGSGAIIGPHTILTASHLLWDADLQSAATSIGIDPADGDAISGPLIFHYFQVDNTNGLMTQSTSQNDFAIIDVQEDLSRFGSFGIQTGYAGGTVHLTGYPTSAGGLQADQVGVVSKASFFSVLNYVSLSPSAGSSGGPVWIDEGTASDPLPYVVGVVSTNLWATQLTSADLRTIQNWEAADSSLWTTGSDGPDSIVGAEIPELINAGGGHDSVDGGAGDDTINGGEGQSYLRGGAGNDVINGGSAFDDINGNMGNDTAHGSDGDDWVVGGKDNDLLYGDRGDDLVYGNLGDDTCDGGEGADIVRGGQGNDSVAGGDGADYVSGDRGDDTVTGGAGADIFHSFGEAGIDRVLDFHVAEGDRVRLDAGTHYSVSQVGADTVVDMTGGGQVILVGVAMSSLTPGWIFVD